MEKVTLVECPRDAMQGIHDFIDTDLKIQYINKLLKCNFDVLDFGSFVSPKAIPQMRDTVSVLEGLDLTNTKTKLLAIIANERGANEAIAFDQIHSLGFPLSVSNTFQLRNTNASIEDAWKQVDSISSLCLKADKKLVVYLSMGFGNPYGDHWSPDILSEFSSRLIQDFDVETIALSDTIGCANETLVRDVFSSLIPSTKGAEISAHLHVNPLNAKGIVEAAYEAGCRRFDGAIKGFGGCPMAKDDLTGNMPTEQMLEWFKSKEVPFSVNEDAFQEAYNFSSKVFN